MRDEWVRNLCDCSGPELNATFETEILPSLMFDTSSEYAAEVELEKRQCPASQKAFDHAAEAAARTQMQKLANIDAESWQGVRSEDLPKLHKTTKARAARLAASSNDGSALSTLGLASHS